MSTAAELGATVVTLPRGGLEVELIECDGNADKILVKKQKKVYQVIPEYIAAHVVRIGDKRGIGVQDILDLLVPDQEFLAIEIYKLKYRGVDGNCLFKFKYSCGPCGADSQLAIDMDSLDLVECDGDTVDIILPRSVKRAIVGILDGNKEAYLMDLQAAGNNDPNQPDFKCLRSLDGRTDFTLKEVTGLPPLDHVAIGEARQRLICGYDTTVKVQCSSCNARGQFNMLTHPSFLRPAG